MLDKKRLIFDVTDLLKWQRPPVGIIRTQLELLKGTLKKYKFNWTFVQFSEDRKFLYSVDIETINNLIVRLESNTFKTNNISKKPNIIKNKINYSLQICKKFFKPFVKYIIVKCRLHNSSHYPKLTSLLKIYRNEGILQVIKKTIYYFFKKVPFLRKLYGLIKSINLIIKRENNKFIFRKNDIYFSMGLEWNYNNTEYLFLLKRQVGFKYISILYDMIPIRKPQYMDSLQFCRRFVLHLYEQNYLADKLVCISNFTKQDYELFCIESGLLYAPELKTIYLGDNAIVSKTNLIDSINQIKLPSQYILYVSTIEARKNHTILVKAWLEAKKLNVHMPDLVFVGSWGWGVNDLYNLIKNSPEIEKHLHLFHGVSDIDIQQIYQKALFCVFPSNVEGWGLGAAEALCYGKVCLISKADALIEATRGLMPSIDSNDTYGWMHQISKLTSDKKYRSELEEKIKIYFKPKNWETFAKEVFEFAVEDTL